VNAKMPFRASQQNRGSISRAYRPDRVAQCIGRKRLREHRPISRKITCVRIGGHEHDLHIWPKSCGVVRQRRAGYARHHNIGQQNTNRGIAIEDAQSLLSRSCADAHHSGVFEGLHHRPTNVRVIVYHEHDGMNWQVTSPRSMRPQTDASPKSIRAVGKWPPRRCLNAPTHRPIAGVGAELSLRHFSRRHGTL
jgi:hypothetical protein